MSPKISILMATYNRANLIGRAIESVRGQTFIVRRGSPQEDWELVIADDGSTDGTPQVVKRLLEKDARIVYIRSEVNQGISKNYNRGLRLAKGEYVAMLDDDDPWADREKLQKQIEFLDKNPEYVGCGGGMIVVDKTGKELYRYLKPQTDEEIRRAMLFSNPLANSTTLFRRAAAQKVGFYDESIRYAGDRDFWLKMGLIGKLYNFPEYFSFYTMSRENTSIARIRPHLKTSLKVMRRYRDKYPNYLPALLFNELQYFYAYLPAFLRTPIHQFLARLKRLTVG